MRYPTWNNTPDSAAEFHCAINRLARSGNEIPENEIPENEQAYHEIPENERAYHQFLLEQRAHIHRVNSIWREEILSLYSREPETAQRIVAPLEPLPINDALNDALRQQRRILPLTLSSIAELLNNSEPGKSNRKREARLKTLIERTENRPGRLHSDLKYEFRRMPKGYAVDESALARALADSELSFAHGENDSCVVSWVTESITLRDENNENEQTLGRFRVEHSLGSSIVHAIALEPNNPTGDSAVTHPHVKRDIICLGELRHKIRPLSACGNVLLIRRAVDSILTNYNPGSPFVKLKNWRATMCPGCDRVCGATALCGQCGCTVCERCSRWCDVTHCVGCNNCIRECCSCHNYLLSRDAIRCGCPHCTRPHCTRCVTRPPPYPIGATSAFSVPNGGPVARPVTVNDFVDDDEDFDDYSELE